jgi:hypothetical protein
MVSSRMLRRFGRQLVVVAGSAALVVLSLLSSGPAMADLDVRMQLICPAQANPGTMVTVDVRLENEECRALGVRLVSTVVGNPKHPWVVQTLSRLGVFGPVLVDGTISVPAATDNLPGTCDPEGECSDDFSPCSTDDDCVSGTCQVYGGTCTGSGGTIWCITDADCVCRGITPGILEISQAVPPVMPLSLADTVVTQLITAEWDGGAETQAENCVIALPEPTGSLQLFSGVLGLLVLSRLRGGRGHRLGPPRSSSGQHERAGGTNQLKENGS